MNKNTELFARDLIPNIVFRVYRMIAGQSLFKGNYATWEEARKESGGYDSEQILTKVRGSLLKVKNGEAVYERDSVLLLAALLWIVSQKGNRLNLVDFGGSLGSTYYQNRKFLSHLGAVRWSIVEQRRFVECGKRDFEDDRLKFYEDLETCVRDQRPDAILLSSVLQYLEQPYALLEKVLSLGFEFILIDRTPLLEKGDDRITVQKVPPEIYEASYPAWFFNREKFLSRFSMRYELMAEFDALSGTIYLQGGRATDKGFIFRKSGAGGPHGV
jgi:putative methyltransferase (TIGR04325 family)